jgi:hypothetical protein
MGGIAAMPDERRSEDSLAVSDVSAAAAATRVITMSRDVIAAKEELHSPMHRACYAN